MLIKKKNSFKITKSKIFESIKNFVFYLFCFQFIIIIVIFFWYQLSPIKKVHTPEKIKNLISNVIFKTTGLEAKKVSIVLTNSLRSAGLDKSLLGKISTRYKLFPEIYLLLKFSGI